MIGSNRKQYDDYMRNAGKATQKPEVFYDAKTGKPKGDLDITWDDVFYILAAMMIIGFITYLVLEG